MPASKCTRLDNRTPPLCIFLRVLAVVYFIGSIFCVFFIFRSLIPYWGRTAAVGISLGSLLPTPLLCWFLAEHIEYRTWLARETLSAIDNLKLGGATARENCEVAAKGLCYRVK